MEPILRGLFIYLFLMLVFTIAGKRSLAEMDTFDFILLLIISETTQGVLVGENMSITYAALLITTFVAAELVMEFLRQKSPKFDDAIQGGPLVIVKNGQILRSRAKKSMVDETDILSSARESHGLERLDQIKYAILETSGGISIIPK